MRHAVGVIGDLNGGLSARTELAAVNRMGGVAFELLGETHSDDAALSVANDLGLALHNADLQPATSLAERADARLPDGNAGHQLLFGDKTNQEILRAAAARERCARPGDRGELYEVATVHGMKPRSNVLFRSGR